VLLSSLLISLSLSLPDFQRWNYHRTSKGKTDKVILFDVTDNPSFGQCAACQEQNLSETATHCPRCGYSLGSCSPYFRARSYPTKESDISFETLRLPERPTSFSFIDYEVTLTPPTGVILVGDGPVAVENVLEHSDVVAGVLKYHQGREYLCLANRGLTPCVGDLIVLVDEISVSHLNTVEVLSPASTPMITHPPSLSLCLSLSLSVSLCLSLSLSLSLSYL
jgi:hypothetical protein